MNSPLLPSNEPARLEVLRRYQIVDTPAEQAFAELSGMAVESLMPENFREGHLRHRVNCLAEPRVRSMAAGLETAGVTATGATSRWKSASGRCRWTKDCWWWLLSGIRM